MKLCKEYLNMTTFEISILLLVKSRTYWYTDCLPIRHHIQELYTFLKMCGFYWATMYSGSGICRRANCECLITDKCSRHCCDHMTRRTVLWDTVSHVKSLPHSDAMPWSWPWECIRSVACYVTLKYVGKPRPIGYILCSGGNATGMPMPATWPCQIHRQKC